MDSNLVIGIDPGIHGAMAGIWYRYDQGVVPVKSWVVNLPYVATYLGRPSRALDLAAVTFTLRHALREVPHGNRVDVVIEQIWPHPGANPVAIGELIRGAALIEGAAVALGLNVSRVPPSVWKAHYPELKPEKLGRPKLNTFQTKHERDRERRRRDKERKDRALDLARKLWPEIDLSKAKDDGKAEALLIARYGLGEVA